MNQQQTAQVDDIRLVALPSAVNCTELFVRFSLTEWSLKEMLDEASDVAKQLVLAVIEKTDPRSPGFVTVRLRLSGDVLLAEVEDDQIGFAHAGAPQVRGKRTGAVPLQWGKLVWCELPLPEGMSAKSVRLPRRGDRRPMTSPVQAQFPEALHTPEAPVPFGEPVGARAHAAATGQGGRHLPDRQSPIDPDLVDRVLVGLQRREW